MPIPIRADTSRKLPVLLYAGVPLIVTGLLWATSANQLSPTQIFCAFLLCWIPWAAYQPWSRGDRQDLPLFAMLATMYWIAYAVPLFWSEHGIGMVTGFHILSEDAITKALYLAFGSVIALWVGMKLAKRWQRPPSIHLDVPENPWRWSYLRLALVASTIFSVFVSVPAPDNPWRQVIVNMQVIIPNVIFVIFLRHYLRGKAIGIDKLLLTAYFLIILIRGLSTGWLANFAGLAVICMAAYLYEKRRLPVRAIIVVLPIVLFLQPGKAKFREQYWKSDAGSQGSVQSFGERTGFWIEASAKAWAHALSDPSGEGFKALSSQTLARVSLLQQTANVVELTPSQIPYQHGWMYSYLLVTFVPRFIWPDKPSASKANAWYPLAYHLILPSYDVGIASGTATETYINFGWLGPPLVMSCLGVFLGLLEKILLRAKSGLLLSSIGVALLPGLLMIESHMAVYVAGLIQQIFFALIVLLPVLVLRTRDNRQRTRQVLRGAMAAKE
jgi:hypothetical protein